MELECRTCLKISNTLQDIFLDDLPHKIESISSVPVVEDDRFPSKICEECARNVHLLYDFRNIIIKCNLILEERFIKKELESLSEEDTWSEKLDTRSEKLDTVLPKVEVLLFESAPSSWSGEQDNENRGEVADCSSSVEDWDDQKTQDAAKSTCNLCGKSISKCNLKKHMLTHTESPVSCQFCGKEFKNSGSLRGHLLIHKVINKVIHFECTECAKVFTNRKGYTDHIRRHKLASKATECSAPSNFSSEQDNGDVADGSSSVEDSDDKKAQEAARSICNVCGKLISKYNLKKHILTHTESAVSCKFCGKEFKNSGSLRGHLLIHKGVHYECTDCAKVFTNRKGYTDHMRRHKFASKTIECSVCDKRFYSKYKQLVHMRSHTGERPYPCKYCEKRFSSGNALKTHIRRHTNEKPFACDHCDMAFPQRVSLRTHIKSKHPDLVLESGSLTHQD